MGKNKTELLEIAKEIMAKLPNKSKKSLEQLEAMSKNQLFDWIKSASKPTESTSAPDPAEAVGTSPSEPSTSDTKPSKTEPARISKTTGKNYVYDCNGCGLRTADKIKSCPTPGCNGTITELEA